MEPQTTYLNASQSELGYIGDDMFETKRRFLRGGRVAVSGSIMYRRADVLW